MIATASAIGAGFAVQSACDHDDGDAADSAGYEERDGAARGRHLLVDVLLDLAGRSSGGIRWFLGR
jgi:hypothetical protein